MARKKQPTLEKFGVRIKEKKRRRSKKVPLNQVWRAEQYALEGKVKKAFSEFRPRYNVKISRAGKGGLKPSYPELWFGVAYLKDLLRGFYYGKREVKVKKREDLGPRKGYDEKTVVDLTLEGRKIEKAVPKKVVTKQADLHGEKYHQAPEMVLDRRARVRRTVDVDVAAKVGNKVIVGEIKKLPDKNSPALVGKYVRETAVLHMLLLTDPRLVRKVVGKGVSRKDSLLPMIIFNRKLTPEERKVAEFELWRARNSFNSLVVPFEQEFLGKKRVESYDQNSLETLAEEQLQRMKAESRAEFIKPMIVSAEDLPGLAERLRKGEQLGSEVPLFPEGPAASPVEYKKTEEEMLRKMTEDDVIARAIGIRRRKSAKPKKKAAGKDE